ncbi:MAG TPA: NAD(P)/FAD-dependent oxidoreductase [Gemmataceae bacterium]|jgi:2-polyprenyl-6-methoxyphenol hydroxylase-like FAD-dependent oxidoreductase|nr:NAD(P)/FAD-dependent oxidoreductase [Gemmataceae bacterium]
MTTSTAAFDVVIVGAGVGGAALALALARAQPLRVLVVDRLPGPGKINRGDSLLPAVTVHLAAWGVLDSFRAAGARMLTKVQVFHHRAGLVFETSFADAGLRHPYLVLPHPDIERVLLEAARATARVTVRYLCRVIRLLKEGGRVCGVALGGADGTQQEVRARLVVGADGASSLVRTALGIPLARVPYDHGYFGIQVDRPAQYEDAMRVELHPAGGILVVPDPSGDRVGLGVLVHRRDEDLFRCGCLDDKLAAIRQRSPLLGNCRAFLKGAHLYKLSRGHAPRYTARGAVLLGDAVHVTNPTAGQGMTMAVEDAAALARHVGAALATGAHGPALDRFLEAYERERRPLNAGLIRWSHWMSRFYALHGRLGDLLRRRVFAFGNSRIGRLIQRGILRRVASRPARKVG